ncbi:hypothetical protein, partial [Mycolicibacterium sp. CBMA 361]|uniref:hypothetical protein n=1 Tax=Mycolicibacterium sp. CBMA 361 TaxID=2606610 RepID=UPI00193D4244
LGPERSGTGSDGESVSDAMLPIIRTIRVVRSYSTDWNGGLLIRISRCNKGFSPNASTPANSIRRGDEWMKSALSPFLGDMDWHLAFRYF